MEQFKDYVIRWRKFDFHKLSKEDKSKYCYIEDIVYDVVAGEISKEQAIKGLFLYFVNDKKESDK